VGPTSVPLPPPPSPRPRTKRKAKRRAKQEGILRDWAELDVLSAGYATAPDTQPVDARRESEQWIPKEAAGAADSFLVSFPHLDPALVDEFLQRINAVYRGREMRRLKRWRASIAKSLDTCLRRAHNVARTDQVVATDKIRHLKRRLGKTEQSLSHLKRNPRPHISAGVAGRELLLSSIELIEHMGKLRPPERPARKGGGDGVGSGLAVTGAASGPEVHALFEEMSADLHSMVDTSYADMMRVVVGDSPDSLSDDSAHKLVTVHRKLMAGIAGQIEPMRAKLEAVLV